MACTRYGLKSIPIYGGKMKRVLIITYSFPPLNNIAARRFGEMSPYLTDFGWEPTIITTNSQGSLSVNIPQGNIIRVGSHPQKTTKITKDSTNGNSIIKNILANKRLLGFNFRIFDRTYYSWYKNIRNALTTTLKNNQYDLILASFGPGASLFLGNYLGKNFNIPWIADFRDLGALYEDQNFYQNFIAKIVDKKIEKRLVSNSVAITSIGNTLSKMLGNEYNKPSYAIYNGWNTTIQDFTKKKSDEKYIYYAGRFYRHQMGSVYKVITILKQFKDIKLVIRSLGPENLNNEILKFAGKMGVSDQVKLLEPCDQDTVIMESQLSLANLVVEDLDKNIYWKKGTLTGKFLGLLPLKPPILTVARNDSEIGNILVKTNKGKLCSTESEIFDFLKSINDYNNTNFKEIEYYSKQSQAKLLAEVFNFSIKN
jgi:hypothetical protein